MPDTDLPPAPCPPSHLELILSVFDLGAPLSFSVEALIDRVEHIDRKGLAR